MFGDFLVYFLEFGAGCVVVIYIIKLLNRLQSKDEENKEDTFTSSTSVSVSVRDNDMEDQFYHSVFANDRTDIFKPGK